MVGFIGFAVAAVILFTAAFFLKNKESKRFIRIGAAGSLVVSLLVGASASFYTQDVGEAKVQVSITGQLVGQTTEPGFHIKAPWVNVRTFDVRNNIISFIGDGSTDNSGGWADGAQITFQDRDGVTGNLDLVVRYSLDGSKVLDIYREYQTQGQFVQRVILNDIRTVARNVPATRGTLQVFNERSQVGAEILSSLEERWEGTGIIVEEVSLQEIRYSADGVARCDDAQAARIAVDRAEAEKEAAVIKAETKVIEAQGVADANGILTESLTPEVLQQRYIDALGWGTVFVVPEGSSPLINVGPGNQSNPTPPPSTPTE